MAIGYIWITNADPPLPPAMSPLFCLIPILGLILNFMQLV